MQLTGKQIVERGIVTGYCKDAIQQQGIDVRVESIREVSVENELCEIRWGEVPEKGKTLLPFYKEVELEDNKYCLFPGYYDIELMESCDIPSNATLHYKTRSSLVRCGAIVHSGQFDAGFKTDNMGCFLHVINPIVIEKGARIAQAIVFESDDVKSEHMYNGQWQNDIQRNETSTTYLS